jgi:hypothetical protein
MGRTSVVLWVLVDLPSDRFLKIYADRWPAESVGSFAQRPAQAFAER